MIELFRVRVPFEFAALVVFTSVLNGVKERSKTFNELLLLYG